MPPNTTFKLQLLDYEVISNVKLILYLMLHNNMQEKADNQAEMQEIKTITSDSEVKSAELDNEQEESAAYVSIK